MSDTNNNQPPFYNEEPDNQTDGGKFNNSEAYQSLMNTVDDMLKTWEQTGKITQPVEGELDQFRKSWFYNNWCVRFRQLLAFTPLGTRGVIAIPNTTFEEWLWWFHEWAEAFMEDYNQFKQLVFQAITAIEKHLEIIDKEIADIDKHLQKIDDEITDIYNHLKKIDDEITDIYGKLHDQQAQINQNTHDIEHNNDKMTSEISALWNSVLQIHNVHSYSFKEDGFYTEPGAPGGNGDMTIDWWYLNDKYPDMGYQFTISANWVSYNGTYNGLPKMQLDLSKIAPDCPVRPGQLCDDPGSWSYGTLGMAVAIPGVGTYQPITIVNSHGQKDTAELTWAGLLGAPSNAFTTSGQININQGVATAVVGTYLNQNWQPPESPVKPNTTTSNSTPVNSSNPMGNQPEGGATSSGSSTGTGSSNATPDTTTSGSTDSSTAKPDTSNTGSIDTGTTNSASVSGGTTDGKSTATTTTPVANS